MSSNNSIELLAPAGDMEKLTSALHFGADACYVSGREFGLRKASKNFTLEELDSAVRLCHTEGARLYVTMNIVPHDADFDGLLPYVHALEEMKVDGVIVSDPGIFMEIQTHTHLPLHISTQASVTNAKTVAFWANLGARRIVLARELSLEEIRALKGEVGDSVELEAFVHGAMCMSISGRCLLSNYMTGRDANRGDCAQACRWRYGLVEEKRPGEVYPVFEEDGKTFIMNSKDLCLLPHLPEVLAAGITSLKIEGRVKSSYYVGTVVNAYRRALDAIARGAWDEVLIQTLMGELLKTSHRPFTTGFAFGNPGRDGQNYASTSYVQDYDFIGVVRGVDEKSHTMAVEVRNRFQVGDEVEVLRARREPLLLTLSRIEDCDGQSLRVANRAGDVVTLDVSDAVAVGDMLRRKKGAVEP
ncbi:MAG: U32 family peptidase [Peptoniphilaceae bacterium]|nr:U32 family peptidase [Peptoniphilaceae bacterium]MDY6085601.1 U32 family peptidase [Peptoniphilaceae bacterium]